MDQPSDDIEMSVNKETSFGLVESHPQKSGIGRTGKIKISIAAVTVIVLSVIVLVVVVVIPSTNSGSDDKETTSSPTVVITNVTTVPVVPPPPLNNNTAAPAVTLQPVQETDVPVIQSLRVFTPTCGPFFVAAASSGVMNISYELGTSSPNNSSAIRITASSTSQGYAAVGFRSIENSSTGHMFGIDVVAFDRRGGVQNMNITTQTGPPAAAPKPSMIVQDRLVIGDLIFVRFFRDLESNDSYNMNLSKGMDLNIAYSLGVGEVGVDWQHHIFAGSHNISLRNC